MRLPEKFLFKKRLEESRLQDDYIVVVPPGLDSKASVLEFFAKSLRMPGYFGTNWDALDECMRDLNWIPNRRIMIEHADLPLAQSSSDRNTYINLLYSWVTDWEDDPSHELLVVFPPQLHEQVTGSLIET